MAASKWAAMGQRSRRSRTTTPPTRRSSRAGAMPRLVVSTSGSSGVSQARAELFDLRFFVRDVLAHDRIELLGFQFVRMQALVLRRCVVMPRACRRDQFDFVAHDCSLNLEALGVPI